MRLIWSAFAVATMVDAFHPPLQQQSVTKSIAKLQQERTLSACVPLALRFSNAKDQEEDDEEDFDSQRQRRRRRRYESNEDDDMDNDDEFDDDDEYEGEEDKEERRGFFDFLFGDDDDDDDDDDEYDDDYEDSDKASRSYSARDAAQDKERQREEEWDLFDGASSAERTAYDPTVLVSNSLLDAIDPEDTTDRVGELFRDGNFWRDVALVAFAWFVLDVIAYNAPPNASVGGIHVPYPTDVPPIDWSNVDMDATLQNIKNGARP